jgi:hypothetical protein
VSVQIDPSIADDRFVTPGTPLTIQQGGGSVRPVDAATAPPGSWWVLTSPASGYSLRGRFAVVPPNQSQGFSDPSARDALIAGFEDVYVRGRDVIVVDQGSTLGGLPPFEPSPGAPPFDFGAPGRGELVVTIGSSLARVSLGQGHYLRLVGSVSPSELQMVARSLGKVSGTSLRYLDHP